MADERGDQRLLDGGPLELLYQRADVPHFALPRALRQAYGGDLGFPSPRLYANFVASVDGVTTLRQGVDSGSIISGRNEADRFLMGLLRACADAVLVGGGTFRMTPGHRWQAAHVYPKAATHFAELRRELRLPERPLLVVVSASGDLDPAHPALREETLIATTPAGAERLRGSVPAHVRFDVSGGASVDLAALVEALRAQGARHVLTEGGPSLVGKLLERGLLDELFLTTSPLLLGRQAHDGRRPLVEGADLLGMPGAALQLWSARRHGSHLFLRYASQASAGLSPPRPGR